MAEQEKRQVPAPVETEKVIDVPKHAAKDSALADGLEDILDEIDEVLETNAEEFVKSYVQKGGQ
jgi:ubiquitin-like protein Pup